MTKSSLAFNLPTMMLKNGKGFKLILHSISQERSATQRDLVIRDCKTDAQGIQSRFYKRYIVANQSS